MISKVEKKRILSRVPIIGIKIKLGIYTPIMLPIAEIAYILPEFLPIRFMFFELILIEKGTIAPRKAIGKEKRSKHPINDRTKSLKDDPRTA